jgi:hypothetical protein
MLRCLYWTRAVFRTTLLAIVLIFAGAPAVSVFCEAWCAPPAEMASSCHHERPGQTAKIGTLHPCQDLALARAVPVRDDSRRHENAPEAASTDLVFAAFPNKLRLPAVGATSASELKRTPLSILRI